MTKSVIVIENSDDDESFSLYVDKEYVKSFTYDEHGFKSMEDIKTTIKKLAEKLNIQVEEK